MSEVTFEVTIHEGNEDQPVPTEKDVERAVLAGLRNEGFEIEGVEAERQ